MPARRSTVSSDPSSITSSEPGTAVVPVHPAGASLARVAAAEHAAQAAQAAHDPDHSHASLADLPPRPAAPLHQPLVRAHKLQSLLQQVACRGAAVQLTAAATLPWQAGNARMWQELWALQSAVAERLQAQQQAWVDGCTALWQDYAQLGRANTVAKVMDQEFGAAARFGTLVKDQAAGFAELVENAQVNWAYWLSQKSSGSVQD
jgi:hypothetical protein